MPESFERDTPENFNGPVNSDGKAVYGKRNAEQVIEARRRRLYRHLNNGNSLRQNVYAHADREGISITTAWRDSEGVKEWFKEDIEKERSSIVARLTAMRFRAIEGAIKSKNWQSAASLMDSLSNTFETDNESAAAAPNLSISIEAPGASFTTGENKP